MQFNIGILLFISINWKKFILPVADHFINGADSEKPYE